MESEFVVLIFIVFLIALGLSFKGIWTLWASYKLERLGVSTQGSVVGLTKSTSVTTRGWWGQNYYVAYRFEIIAPDGNSKMCMQEKSVSKWLYNQLKLGDKIKVRYLPTNPQNSVILE